MMTIRILCVGRVKEKFYEDAAAEYLKRLGAWCRTEITEVPETKRPKNPSPAEIEASLQREASLLEEKIPKGAAVIALCVEGEQPDSEGVAALLEKYASSGVSKLCFVIGGSDGLHPQFKARVDRRISMSRMTFPHHLARVMLLEQLYRGFQINEGGKDHK